MQSYLLAIFVYAIVTGAAWQIFDHVDSDVEYRDAAVMIMAFLWPVTVPFCFGAGLLQLIFKVIKNANRTRS